MLRCSTIKVPVVIMQSRKETTGGRREERTRVCEEGEGSDVEAGAAPPDLHLVRGGASWRDNKAVGSSKAFQICHHAVMYLGLLVWQYIWYLQALPCNLAGGTPISRMDIRRPNTVTE
jgi:hypothetical protein